jgi:hypothetical protein
MSFDVVAFARREAELGGLETAHVLAIILLGRTDDHALAVQLANERMRAAIDADDAEAAQAYADAQVWMHARGWAAH